MYLSNKTLFKASEWSVASLGHMLGPAFSWHQGPKGPKNALWAYPENFVTEPHTLRLLHIDKYHKLKNAELNIDVFLLPNGLTN